MLTTAQEDALIQCVREVAKAEILPHFRALSSGEVKTKSAYDDLVTVADLASERALIEKFSTLLPDAKVIGEECVTDDPSLLGGFEEQAMTIVIDPIDGTWNFAHGLSTFGVLIAGVAYGKTVFGLLYDPVNDDWVRASLGRGCWYGKPNAEDVRISLGAEVSEPRLTGLMSPALFADDVKPAMVLKHLEYARISTLRCACHEYRSLVQGAYDFFVQPKPNVWDHAAGIIAYQEAGGLVKMLDGREYSPSITKGTIVAARTPEVMARLEVDFKTMVLG